MKRAFDSTNKAIRPDLTAFNSPINKGATHHMDTTIVYAGQQHSVAASLKKSEKDKMEKYNDRS